MDWFLYDNGLHHERVKNKVNVNYNETRAIPKLFEINNNYKGVKLNDVPISRLTWSFIPF